VWWSRSSRNIWVPDDPLAVVVLDESGQQKNGELTCGAKRQYVGWADRVSNAVNVVYATLATARGHAQAAARPYLPREWFDDPRLRKAAAAPEHVVFKTKPALATDILTDLHRAGLLPPWVTGDAVYGKDAGLRGFCERHDVGYVFGIPCSFFYCYVPDDRPATLPALAAIARRRWPVEEDFQIGKDQFGMDHSQVRRYTALLRHLVLTLIALAACAVTAAATRQMTNTTAPPPTIPHQDRPKTPASSH
jgi:SRSO17 transposase